MPPSSAATISEPITESWTRVRSDTDIQFAPIEIPEPVIEPPSAFERALEAFFQFLGEILGPVGGFLANSWPVLKWVLLAALAVFVIYSLINLYGTSRRNVRTLADGESEPEWEPSRAESLALLEDADRLAAEGHYDAATHLLLQRSVGHIASARPEWVEPSSTARELAELPTLTLQARDAFRTISQRVERSLFALRSLDAADWEAARAAYAQFAEERIGARS
ncbi:hypothetical protein KCG45_07550 [Erythrobacter sp. WH131]|uniref:DUF4129 domain-containing protein n=1 Tax=Erythrobacter ani TaxID=2827235 RepID=A0ABS6SNE5_9SPHN|nr:hypothetical protein [Erythrobacter ani]